VHDKKIMLQNKPQIEDYLLKVDECISTESKVTKASVIFSFLRKKIDFDLIFSSRQDLLNFLKKLL